MYVIIELWRLTQADHDSYANLYHVIWFYYKNKNKYIYDHIFIPCVPCFCMTRLHLYILKRWVFSTIIILSVPNSLLSISENEICTLTLEANRQVFSIPCTILRPFIYILWHTLNDINLKNKYFMYSLLKKIKNSKQSFSSQCVSPTQWRPACIIVSTKGKNGKYSNPESSSLKAFRVYSTTVMKSNLSAGEASVEHLTKKHGTQLPLIHLLNLRNGIFFTFSQL